MTDRNTGRNRSRLDLSPVIPWLNTAGSTVPAYGVVQFRDDYVSGYSQATKPNGSEGLFFVNGPVDVANAAHGESLLWDRPRQVLINGTVTVGDEVGPVDGQWYMSVNGSGWRVLHQAVDGVGVVVQAGAKAEFAVILDSGLAAATNSKTGATSATATVCEWDGSQYTETYRQVTVWNHSEYISHLVDTFGFAKLIQSHYVFFGDCDAMVARG